MVSPIPPLQGHFASASPGLFPQCIELQHFEVVLELQRRSAGVTCIRPSAPRPVDSTAGPTDCTPVSTRGQRRRLEGRWADRPRDNATAFYSLTSAVSIRRRVHV
ncbi:hypothetical protein EVAR_96379_1 [Eumeta japonica]|uniref:Uncharacterized protein n=1 Tax=Eumeta variegata TaxID=151549 RepID=A0A4C1WCY9_EUMVA|nr:hypothetical protein EVAR_96379_1 [Eumeta japonica]